jgi:hypothetical protein
VIVSKASMHDHIQIEQTYGDVEPFSSEAIVAMTKQKDTQAQKECYIQILPTNDMPPNS